MQLWEIAVMGVALAMDAVSAGAADGASEPYMSPLKMLFIAGMYAFFQFFMPFVGYAAGYAFYAAVRAVAPWLSFGLLVFIGGKAAAEGLAAAHRASPVFSPARKRGAGKILLQAVATSLDALAVGITLLAAESSVGLPLPLPLCTLVIGEVTFLLSLPAVALGKRAGVYFAERAEVAGGVVLIAIGVKILLEGLL